MNKIAVQNSSLAEKTIVIDESRFGDNPLDDGNPSQPKLNIKINKVDLAVLDQLAKLTGDTRSYVMNALIEALVYKFFRQDVENFDTRYLLAAEADKRNPELNEAAVLDKSWFYEIDPSGQLTQLSNSYYQREDYYSQEHDDIKSILNASAKNT